MRTSQIKRRPNVLAWFVCKREREREREREAGKTIGNNKQKQTEICTQKTKEKAPKIARKLVSFD
jgi:hypothetical protein